MYRRTRATGARSAWPLAGLTGVALGCVLAAPGAGVGGGMYFTERGVESVVPASGERATAAPRQAFGELKVTEPKTGTEPPPSGDEQQKLEAAPKRRDVSVTLTSRGRNTRVPVVATTSAIPWDKDFPRNVLNRIIAYSR